MKSPTFSRMAMAAALLLSFGTAGAQTTAPAADDTPVYGSQLMTQQERIDFRAKMRAAKTDAERDQLRREHHDQMKARAAAKGITLPDEPPARGAGKGMGPGMGGMGPGPGMGGMGPGPGMGGQGSGRGK